MTADTGRIVIVAAGFALWKGGRCIAAARWSDVHRIRAYRANDTMCLAVELKDGSAVEMRQDVPGWMEFAAAASGRLTGFPPPGAWMPAVAALPGAMDETVLFERSGWR